MAVSSGKLHRTAPFSLSLPLLLFLLPLPCLFSIPFPFPSTISPFVSSLRLRLGVWGRRSTAPNAFWCFHGENPASCVHTTTFCYSQQRYISTLLLDKLPTNTTHEAVCYYAEHISWFSVLSSWRHWVQCLLHAASCRGVLLLHEKLLGHDVLDQSLPWTHSPTTHQQRQALTSLVNWWHGQASFSAVNVCWRNKRENK